MPDPFITEADLTAMLGRNVDNDGGATIAVDAACDMVRTMTGQQFNRGTSTVTLDGSGTDALLLPQLPVANVGTVVVSNGTVTDYVLKDNGVLIRKVDDPAAVEDWWSEYRATQVVWPYGRQNVEVTYVHGYDNADIPRDIRIVALTYATRLIVQGPALQEALGQASIRYAIPSTDLTRGEMAVLRKYRR